MFADLEHLGRNLLFSSLYTSSQLHPSETACLSYFFIIIGLILRYLLYKAVYHFAHLRQREKQPPPSLPYFIPLLGNTIPFVFDRLSFFTYAT